MNAHNNTQNINNDDGVTDNIRGHVHFSVQHPADFGQWLNLFCVLLMILALAGAVLATVIAQRNKNVEMQEKIKALELRIEKLEHPGAVGIGHHATTADEVLGPAVGVNWRGYPRGYLDKRK